MGTDDGMGSTRPDTGDWHTTPHGGGTDRDRYPDDRYPSRYPPTMPGRYPYERPGYGQLPSRPDYGSLP